MHAAHLLGLALPLLTLGCATLATPALDAAPVLAVWPAGPPDEPAGLEARRRPTDTGDDGITRIRFVDTPTLTLFHAPADRANGCCVIVCPGGGYNLLAWTHEGTEVAAWLNSLGVTAVVLQYRVPRRDATAPHPWPLQDAQRAVRLTRQHAAAWGIDPERVGLLGFSAGGHLALVTGTRFDERSYAPVDDADALSARPDFLVPIYAAYLADPADPERLTDAVRVTPDTPPVFMAVTLDDATRGVDAARLLIELKRNDVEAELHVYTRGGHGYGLRDHGLPVNSWPARCAEWLAALGFLEAR